MASRKTSDKRVPDASSLSGSALPGASRSQIIVLGMHRSGTSALTGFLRLCGAWVGDEDALNGSNAENPKGFWERRDVRDICDALLHAADADWCKISDFDLAEVPRDVIAEQQNRFRAIASELDSHGTWVLKEPRLCLLFPLLRPAMNDPVCIHIYRHPVEVARSLQVRNGFGISEGLALWEAYTLAALRASAGQPRLLASYEKLASGDHSEARRIVEQLQKMGVTGLRIPDQAEIDAFLTPDLRRQKADGEEVLDYMLPSQRRLWQQMENGAALGAEAAEKIPDPSLQHLRDLEDLIALRQNLADTNAQLAATQSELSRSERTLASIKQTLSWRATEPARKAKRIVVGYNGPLVDSVREKSRHLRTTLKPTVRTLTGNAVAAARTIARKVLPYRVRKLLLSRYNRIIRSKSQFHLGELGRPASYRSGGTQSRPWWFGFKESNWQFWLRAFSTSPSDGTLDRLKSGSVAPAIIVPVYNAIEETENCLNSLLRHTNLPCRILVINDASPDPKVAERLAAFDGRGSIEVFHNPENLGFTRTINRGIELAGNADVVFLNSDTVVTPGWLRNLRVAAYSKDRVATVTPLSNNAGAFSVPEMGRENPIPGKLGLDSYGRAITQASKRSYPSVPTGNGFCLYVRRDCINEIGTLDAEAFPRGYGEENDFCMRAVQHGWSNLIDDATLIYHVRSASFSEAKAELLKQGRAIVDARYPQYKQAIGQFTSSEILKAVRKRVADVITRTTGSEQTVRPRILYVLSTATGGTPQTNQDLMEANEAAIEPFVLRSDASVLSLLYFSKGTYIVMETYKLKKQIEPFPHRSQDYDDVIARWLIRYSIELVHVRSNIWHGLGLAAAAKSLSIPVVFSFHDYYTICPTIKLVDENEQYCAGTCTPSLGDCKPELWSPSDFPPLKHAAIHDWQRQMQAMLRDCDAYVTTQTSVRDIISNVYGLVNDKAFHVIPHGRDFGQFERVAAPLSRSDTIRLVVPGNISRRKGAHIIAQLAERLGDTVEIHILGRIAKDVTLPGNVIDHGEYRREEFGEKVRAIKPHLGGVFSIWPETYCHTLTELWASGIPVLGFDFGAVGERIRESGAGWLTAAPTADEIINVLDRLREMPSEHAAAVDAVGIWQDTTGATHTRRHMGEAYLGVYGGLMRMAARADNDGPKG